VPLENPKDEPTPSKAIPEIPLEHPNDDPKVQVIGVFPAKSSIKQIIQQTFQQTFQQDSDDITIIEPAVNNVHSKKPHPNPIKLRKLSTGDHVWDFGFTGSHSVVNSSTSSPTKSEFPLSTPKEEGEYIEFSVPSSATAVAKSKLSFPTCKTEQDEYAEIKVPPAPTITLSFQDPGDTSHLCMGNKFNIRGPEINCEVSEVIEVLPNKSNKKRK